MRLNPSWDITLMMGGGEILYEVKWKGYTAEENTEEKYENFNSKNMITHYWKKINKFNPHAKQGTSSNKTKTCIADTNQINAPTSSKRVKQANSKSEF